VAHGATQLPLVGAPDYLRFPPPEPSQIARCHSLLPPKRAEVAPPQLPVPGHAFVRRHDQTSPLRVFKRLPLPVGRE
jgi:hypothetical protein